MTKPCPLMRHEPFKYATALVLVADLVPACIYGKQFCLLSNLPLALLELFLVTLVFWTFWACCFLSFFRSSLFSIWSELISLSVVTISHGKLSFDTAIPPYIGNGMEVSADTLGQVNSSTKDSRSRFICLFPLNSCIPSSSTQLANRS